MNGKPIIAVTGATGDQGSSVVYHLLADPEHQFAVRAICRHSKDPNTTGDLIQWAKKHGGELEIVEANWGDVESLKKAFNQCYGVYGMTDFWEYGEETETQHGKNMVEAAKFCEVKHFVFSTAPHTEPNQPKVPVMAAKATIDDYLKASGVPRTSLYNTFWYEMFFKALPPIYRDGAYHWMTTFPKTTSIFYVSVWDLGGFVTAIFKDPKRFLDTDVRAAAEILTTEDLQNQVAEVTGEKVVFHSSPSSRIQKLAEAGDPAASVFYPLMKFFDKQNLLPKDLEASLEVYPRARRWRDVVKSNKKQLEAVKAKGMVTSD